MPCSEKDDFRYNIHLTCQRRDSSVAPESLTGDPEIDWDENLIVRPQISSLEAFEIMVSFTKEQELVVRDELREIRIDKKPLQNFKDTGQIIGLEKIGTSFRLTLQRKNLRNG